MLAKIGSSLLASLEHPGKLPPPHLSGFSRRAAGIIARLKKVFSKTDIVSDIHAEMSLTIAYILPVKNEKVNALSNPFAVAYGNIISRKHMPEYIYNFTACAFVVLTLLYVINKVSGGSGC